MNLSYPDDGRGIEDLEDGQLKERELGHLRSESLQGMLASKVTCLEARSLLAKTQVYSSLKDAEDFSPYTSGESCNLEKFIYLINIMSSKRGLLNPGVTIIWDNGSIYRRGSFDVYGQIKINLGVNSPKVTWVFTSKALNCQSN